MVHVNRYYLVYELANPNPYLYGIHDIQDSLDNHLLQTILAVLLRYLFQRKLLLFCCILGHIFRIWVLDWHAEVHAAVDYRPAEWTNLTSNGDGQMHALDFCRGVDAFMSDHPDTIMVCDGGEIGQWSQGMLDSERRIINGVAGSIGSAIPFGLAACKVEKDAPVIAISGDGAFGYHLAELDTAIRCDLPLIAIVGNDARWNAEHQIQVRAYGANRIHGCALLPTRYDLVAEALGAHGELVTDAAELSAALERAYASGKPACINVMIEGHPAPIVRRHS